MSSRYRAATYQIVDHEDLIETLEQLIDAGETLPGGGVSNERLAEEMGFARQTIARHTLELEREGDLELDWGFTEHGSAQAYRPAGGEP